MSLLRRWPRTRGDTNTSLIGGGYLNPTEVNLSSVVLSSLAFDP